jgi:hypothetical protein
MTTPLNNTIVLLMGFPGTGKYTIGRELVKLTGAKLIDNHLINNPVFTAINADGIRPLPAGVWDKVSSIRQIVYESIRELSPPGLSFIFTIHVVERSAGDHKAFLDLAELAQARKSLFVPFRLVCEVEELCRRVVDPARAERLKQIRPESARNTAECHTVLEPDHPNLRTLDVTGTTPHESALLIMREINSIKGYE